MSKPPAEDLEQKWLAPCNELDFKFANEGDSEIGVIEGYASIFGELDQGGDIVRKGAFTKSLAQRRKNDRWDIPMFFGHAHSSVPMGVWTDFREDSKGLKCKGRLIFEVPEAKQVRAVILAGGGMGVSIGYKTLKRVYVGPDGKETDDWVSGAVRHLIEVDLGECSLTAMPMCRGAGITSAKSELDQDEERKAAEAAHAAALIRALEGANHSFALKHALTSAAAKFGR